MTTIRLPANGWRPRDYQRPAWMSWQGGCKRQLLFWHRRAGKDELNLHQHAVSAFKRAGTYWHMLPQYAQARKAIWNAVNAHTGKRRIDEAFPRELRANTNEQEMFIRFINGATWQVVGSDNFDALVGTPPVGITFSEWALANPTAWAYLSPILAENGGWASFITTPRGNNHAKKMLDAVKGDPKWFTQVLGATETGAISDDAIEEQRVTYRALFGDEVADMLIDQEFHCSFAGALVGSYFASAMARAEADGRVGRVDIDWSKPIHTAWDLGVSDSTSIWVFQVAPDGPRVVDFYEAHGVGLEHYVEWLGERNYTTGDDWVPHDIRVQEWASGRLRIDVMREMRGREPKRVPKVGLAEGIQAARQTIELSAFDSERCALGLDALKAYRREWDDDRKCFHDRPVHDWSSHAADAFRYMSLSWRQIVQPRQKVEAPKELVYTANADGSVSANMDIRQQIDAMIKRKKRRGVTAP